MVVIPNKNFIPKGPIVTSNISLLVWGTLSIVLGLLFLPVSLNMVQIWVSSPTYLHGSVILPICLYLIWEKRTALVAYVPQPTWVGLIPTALSGILLITGAQGDFNILQHTGLVGIILSTAIVILGLPLSHFLRFPLFYLVFMVPFGAELTPFLQNITADIIVFIVRLVGIPILRDGLLLETPAGSFFVADACAGLRFLIATIVVSVLFCHFFFTSRLKIGLFLVLAILVPVIANGLRAASIVIIATLSDMALAVGLDHIVYGWGFFAFILGAQFFIGYKLADPPRSLSIPPAERQPPPLTQYYRVIAAFFVLLALIYSIWIKVS